MATAEGAPAGVAELQVEKGLKPGALGLVSSIVMGVASTAPAYSLAATLGFIVAVVGLGSPIVAVIAFVPIFLTSIGYSELNKADPDCGTTFTWAARAFGPKTGWAGGVRAEDGLGCRLGHRRRRRAGHGQPRAGRGPVPVPAVRREGDRQRPDERLGAGRPPGGGP